MAGAEYVVYNDTEQLLSNSVLKSQQICPHGMTTVILDRWQLVICHILRMPVVIWQKKLLLSEWQHDEQSKEEYMVYNDTQVR